MGSILLKLIKPSLKINFVVPVAFIVIVGLAYFDILTPIQAYNTICLTLLISFCCLVSMFIKNKALLVNSQKIVLLSFKGLFILLLCGLVILACIYVLIDGF